MSEAYFNMTLVFQMPETAEAFHAKLRKEMDEDNDELINALNTISEIQIETEDDDTEYDIESLERTGNVIDLQLVGGGWDDGEETVPALTAHGAEIIIISQTTEYEDDPETSYFQHGHEVTKKKDIKALLAKLPQDPLSEFFLAIKRRKYKKALKLYQSVEAEMLPNRIDDDDILYPLTDSVELADIAVPLIKQGLFDDHPNYIDALDGAILYANIEAVKALLMRLPDAEVLANRDQILESAMISRAYRDDGSSGLDQIQWLMPWLESKGIDVNHITEKGSTVWLGYEYQKNLHGVRYVQQRGGIAIAPAGFYDNLSELEKMREAASHDDLATLKALNILDKPALVEILIFWALFNRCLLVMRWLAEQGIEIDWLGIPDLNWEGVPEEERMTFLEGVPRYQLPFGRHYQEPCDDVFATLVLDAIAKVSQSPEPLTKLVCIFANYRVEEGVDLIRRAHQLGAELSTPVYFEGGDNAIMENTYPLRRACSSTRLDYLEYLLELGATVPQGLDTTIDMVDYVKENYSTKERKETLKILKKYGYT